MEQNISYSKNTKNFIVGGITFILNGRNTMMNNSVEIVKLEDHNTNFTPRRATDDYSRRTHLPISC